MAEEMTALQMATYQELSAELRERSLSFVLVFTDPTDEHIRISVGGGHDSAIGLLDIAKVILLRKAAAEGATIDDGSDGDEPVHPNPDAD